jgi:DNA polymerase-3 subunit gamma/tau
MAQQQYQVLARKWRPQQFDEVVGQEHVATTLKNAIDQQRLAHAYLFVGPRGTGKTSIARILAKALNCVKGPTVKPCDKCDNCREIAEGRSLDVLEIDGASNNGVEQVRELRDTVRYAPARGKFKIYIIDEVHMLTKEAFNALLKTLEEPPAHVKFLFATTEPQKVLPTILSRCQRFDLRRIPANLIVKRLQEIARDEKVKIDDAALLAIARGAEGGLRDAESALDQLIAFCGDEIAEKDVLAVFGLVAHKQLATLTDAIIDGEINVALKVLKELDEAGKDLQRLLAELLDHFRNLLVVTLVSKDSKLATPTDIGVELPETELDLLKAQAQRIDSDIVLRVIDALAAAEGKLRYALSKRILFEIAVVKAIKARETVSLDALLKKLNELKGNPGNNPSAPVPAANPRHQSGRANLDTRVVAPTTAATPTASLEDAWTYAVEHLGKVTPLAKTYLVGTKPLHLQGNVVVIGFDPEFAERREFVDTARNRELLQSRLGEKLRMNVSLKFEVTDDATEPPATPPAPPPKAHGTPAVDSLATPGAGKNLDEFRNDPLIKKALEIFKGTIVEVRK